MTIMMFLAKKNLNCTVNINQSIYVFTRTIYSNQHSLKCISVQTINPSVIWTTNISLCLSFIVSTFESLS